MKRLTDKHPAMIALREVIALMDEKKISIHYGRYGNVTMIHGEEAFSLQDNDSSESINEFPPMMEYKLIAPDSED